ncbi:hypothetical protein BCR42DRAFT_428629 [Absidia repens]|uniref:RRM domain-containing protein n=1 Tax=Absidia repens TaxID=90262 RepID=A0A1X2HYA8_9FUNG|nr:hypothetical protein BCR42DRAFT_428629 [Absidia repens]
MNSEGSFKFVPQADRIEPSANAQLSYLGFTTDDKENMFVDDSVAQVDIDALQGETLVSNSPYPDSPMTDDQDDSESLADNDDPSIDKRGSPLACIFVASLNKHKTEDALNVSVYQKFEKWGKLLHVKVFKDCMNRPYAFVQYERIGDAKQALLKAPGTILDGRTLRCEPARVNRSLVIESTELPLDEQDIANKLSTYGPIEQIHIVTGAALTTAYIMFSYRDDAVKAFLRLKVLARFKHWKVEWITNNDLRVSGNGKCSDKNTCIFVGNLGRSIEKSEIQERFGEYGPIESIRIVKKKTENLCNTTFGFIRYASYNSATMAINTEDGQQWHGRTLHVSYQEDQQKRFDSSSSNMDDVVTTADSHIEHFGPRPHSPGVVIPSAVVATTSTCNIYPQPKRQPHLATQSTKETALSPSCTILTTTTMSTTKIANFNTGTNRHRHQEHLGSEPMARTALNSADSVANSLDSSNDSQENAETHLNRRSIQPLSRLHSIEQTTGDTESATLQDNQDYSIGPFPPHGYYYWYPPIPYPQVYPPIYSQTTNAYDTSGGYYQMHPYAGTYYFIPIAKPFVATVPGTLSNTTIQSPPLVWPPAFQPIHYPLPTSKKISPP